VELDVVQVAQVFIVDQDLRRQLEAETRNHIRSSSELAEMQARESVQMAGIVSDRRLKQEALESDRQHSETDTPVQLLRIANQLTVLRAQKEKLELERQVRALEVERDLIAERASQELRRQMLPLEQAPQIVESVSHLFDGANLSVYGEDCRLMETVEPLLNVISRRSRAPAPTGPRGRGRSRPRSRPPARGRPARPAPPGRAFCPQTRYNQAWFPSTRWQLNGSKGHATPSPSRGRGVGGERDQAVSGSRRDLGGRSGSGPFHHQVFPSASARGAPPAKAAPFRSEQQRGANDAHRVLAELEIKKLIRSVITQNIDNLHWRAGSRNVLELHGNIREMICLQCGRLYPLDTPVEGPSRCQRCGTILKPNCVLFGEALPKSTWYRPRRSCGKPTCS